MRRGIRLAKALLVQEALGEDDVPDYLGVSLSSTDYVGHVFGPSSLESEDNLLRLDRVLASLLDFVDEKVGLDRVLVVLSSDHGSPEAPGYLLEHGIEAAYVDPKSWDRAPAIEALKQEFGIGEELFLTYSHPYLYLVFSPHHFINDFDGLTVASTHGSPWRYDTFVPVVFMGAGVPSRTVHRRVHTVDVAPTIAAFLGTRPPSGAAGEVLVEVFGE